MIRYLFYSILFIMTFSLNVMAEEVIIVHRDNPINEISTSQLKRIYNGTIKYWENGSRIIPVDMVDSNPSALHFSRQILGVDMDIKRKFWIQKIFAGAGTPPRQEKDGARVVSFVASEPGAIGYARKEDLTSAVKSISVDGRKHF